MELSITTLTRRKNGSIGRREEKKTCESLRVGRDTKDELFLPDHRIPYHLATLHPGEDGFFIEAEGENDLRLNGAITQRAHVELGDIIGIGPYELTLVEPEKGIDLAVTVELIHPVGDDVEELLSRSTLSINNSGFSKRTLSWTLGLLILVLFLVLPILDGTYDVFRSTGPTESAKNQTNTMFTKNEITFDFSWHTGEVMDSHKFFAHDCEACHTKPFVMVEDQACIACHQKTHEHFDLAQFSDPELSSARCASCHTDHQGPEPLRASQQALCSDCHTNLEAKAKGTKLINASDFGLNHPQFKPTVWMDASAGKQERISLDDAPKENSNLKFPHDVHLIPERMRNPNTGKQEKLDCASCHVPDMSTQFFKPVNMEEHCGDCHVLSFDPNNPDRLAPHAGTVTVQREVKEYFSDMALSGNIADKGAPASLRRRPGEKLTENQRLEALSWADKKTQEATSYLFSASQCGVCHQLQKASGEKFKYKVEPIKITSIWQPLSVFNHEAHADSSCESCHTAGQSSSSSDVLLPKIESCRDCHGGQLTSDKIPSTCISCHGFHNDELALMLAVTGQ